MRKSYTAVVERAIPLGREFVTEPYEAGWASEAVIFIKVREDMGADSILNAWIRISPDGIDWVNEGTQFPEIREKGLYFARITNFGNWLQVAGNIQGEKDKLKALIYLALKE